MSFQLSSEIWKLKSTGRCHFNFQMLVSADHFFLVEVDFEMIEVIQKKSVAKILLEL